MRQSIDYTQDERSCEVPNPKMSKVANFVEASSL